MNQEGMLEEGLEIVRAVSDRFDGEKRNPWNEFECGSNYVRSMASYALLLAISGFEYDMTEGYVGFKPRVDARSFRSFWCLHSGWGSVSRENGQVRLTVLHGVLNLRRFHCDLPEGSGVSGVQVRGTPVPYEAKAGTVYFEPEVSLSEGDTLELML